MDISDATLIGISAALVISSATVIAAVNFRRIFHCCLRKPVETTINPLQEWA
jgi:hypothetical protein